MLFLALYLLQNLQIVNLIFFLLNLQTLLLDHLLQIFRFLCRFIFCKISNCRFRSYFCKYDLLLHNTISLPLQALKINCLCHVFTGHTSFLLHGRYQHAPRVHHLPWDLAIFSEVLLLLPYSHTNSLFSERDSSLQ